MTVGIVTDSTCDLPPEVTQELGITVVPIVVISDGKQYRDGIDLPRAAVYQRLMADQPTSTATPSPEAFRQAYEHLAVQGISQILSIHIATGFSAVCNVARQVASEFKQAAVTVFDSRQVSLGMGFQVLEAAQAAVAGRSLGDILEMLNEQVTRIHTYAVLNTLEYLRRSGRVNKAVAALGNLLQIKPFLHIYNGEVFIERFRTLGSAQKRLEAVLQASQPLEKVSLLHVYAVERANALMQAARDLLPGGKVWLTEVNPAVGVHLGPETFGFACLEERG
ncbi:MAG: DegV family protein [Anaerolineae bacterium]|nr:DegV family protein [Anaerolineae bacterium]